MTNDQIVVGREIHTGPLPENLMTRILCGFHVSDKHTCPRFCVNIFSSPELSGKLYTYWLAVKGA